MDGDTLRIGPLTTFTETRRDPEVQRRWPLLAAASRELGALQIQNRATWAGNVANASPAADGVPALLAYDASLELASVRELLERKVDEETRGDAREGVAARALLRVRLQAIAANGGGPTIRGGGGAPRPG